MQVAMKDYNIKPLNANVDTKIFYLLKELGMGANLRGYTYITEGIKMMLERSEYKHSVFIDLIPDMAKKMNRCETSIDQAVRTAIKKSWLRGNPSLQNKIFGWVLKNKEKPSVSEYICQLVRVIELDMIEIKE